jgi:hypothetical protein
MNKEHSFHAWKWSSMEYVDGAYELDGVDGILNKLANCAVGMYVVVDTFEIKQYKVKVSHVAWGNNVAEIVSGG